MKKKAISDYIGVDVSKDKLDLFWKKRKRYDIIPNNKDSILKYLDEHSKYLLKNVIFCVDNTGGYENVLIK